MFYWLIALSSTFLIQVGNVYVSNIIFFIWILIRIVTGKYRFSFDNRGLCYFILYLGWILFSMILFIIQYGYFEVRNLIQFAYNVQYIILIADGTVEKDKLRRAIYCSSYLLAIVLIILWVTVTKMMSIPTLIVHHREWAEGLVGGWPNSTVLPLLFGVYMEAKYLFRERKILNLVKLGVLLFALLLCTSRTGYLGAAAIIGYFLFTEKEGKGNAWKLIKYSISFVLIVIAGYSLYSTIIGDESMVGRMFMVADRFEIFHDTFAYISGRPITGYGGNSVDVVYDVVGATTTGINWGHTHNTILELLIRHGIVGAVIFCLLVFHVSKRITVREDKAMYWILWAISILQIFYKDFVFLLLIYVLIPNKMNENPLVIQVK